MWINSHQFQKIDRFLVSGARGLSFSGDLSLTLLEAKQGAISDVKNCPVCRHDLERRVLPFMEVFVQACPNGHGVSMPEEVFSQISQLVKKQAISWLPAKIAQLDSRSMQSLFFIGFLIALMIAPALIPKPFDKGEPAVKSHVLWSDRKVEPAAFPSTDSSIQNSEEWKYLEDIMFLIKEGIANRLNIQEALEASDSSEKIADIFSVYEAKQQEFLTKLNTLLPPPALNSFHEKLVLATASQIDFYAAFTAQKLKKKSTTLASMIDNPSLHISNRNLLAAYSEIKKVYPSMDVLTDTAIYERLCAFDII